MNITRKYNCLLLDFDFTIADSSKGIIECFNRAFSALELPICPEKEIVNTIGMSLIDAFFVLQKNQSLITANQFVHLFHEAASLIMIEGAILYNGVKEFLRWTKDQGIKVGIVTAKDSFTVKKILQKYSCEKFVDEVIGEEDVVLAKPNAEPLNIAIKKLCSNNLSSLYIGDCLVDAEMACNAKVDFIAVLTGKTSTEEFLSCGFPVMSIFNNIIEFWNTYIGVQNNNEAL